MVTVTSGLAETVKKVAVCGATGMSARIITHEIARRQNRSGKNSCAQHGYNRGACGSKAVGGRSFGARMRC
jgi:hypothetical protein